MRRRLLWSTLAAVAVAVVLFGAPLAVAMRVLLESQALEAQQREVEQIEAVLDQEVFSLAQAEAILTLIAAGTEARLTLLTPAGAVLVDTGDAPAGATLVTAEVQEATAGAVGQRVADGAVAVAVPIQIRGTDFILRSVQTDADLRGNVRGWWLGIAGLALLAAGAAVLVARRQGTGLASPMEALAVSAARLGDGDFSVRAPRSGLPEADDVAAALDRTAERLGTVLERHRSLGADASHQLRTPLTGLRLQLESLQIALRDSGREDFPGLVESALEQADRLEATIDELLTLARPPEGEERLRLDELATERLRGWQELADAQGRRVELRAGAVPIVRARRAAIGQCLQVLLDNALEHGTGTITVSVEPIGSERGREVGTPSPSGGPARPGDGARLCVTDEGPRIPAGLERGLFERPGRGLALARSLVQAEGGRLTLDRGHPTMRFCLVLPGDVARPPEAVPDARTPNGLR